MLPWSIARGSATLPPTALVRITTIDPALNQDQAEGLVEAIGKLFVQFHKEARCSDWRVAVELAGRALVLAWVGAPLSGCSHDKLHQVQAIHESRLKVNLLAAPPLLIEVQDGALAVDRLRLRELAQADLIDSPSAFWPVRSETWGEWQAGPMMLGDSPFANVLTRHRR